jgi:hypothetical protein
MVEMERDETIDTISKFTNDESTIHTHLCEREFHESYVLILQCAWITIY